MYMIEILERIFRMDGYALFTYVFVPLWTVIMIVTRGVLLKKEKSLDVWRLLCFVPAAVCIAHYFICGFRGNISLTATYYLSLYIGALFCALMPLTAKRRIGRKIYSAIAAVMAFACSLYSILIVAAVYTLSDIGNYTRTDYVGSFHGIISEMKKNYPIAEHKGIDFDAIEAELMPRVEKAQADNDASEFYEVLCDYMYMFHDEHMSISIEGGDLTYIANAVKTAKERIAGEDRGFSMFRLSSGETVAVLTEEDSDAYRAGIHDGTVITAWDGVPVDEAAAEVKCLLKSNFPSIENEDAVRAVFLAGKGGETVDVTFIDDSGKEKTVSLAGIGSYNKRLTTVIDRLTHIKAVWYASGGEYENLGFVADMTEEEREAFFAEKGGIWEKYCQLDNMFSARMLNDHVGCIVMNCAEYDMAKDIIAMMNGSYPEIADIMNSKLEELRSQGMTKLVIDARNNSGGMPVLSGEAASLFTDEPLYLYTFARKTADGYVPVTNRSLGPDGRWKELDVAVLTNFRCVSAGDMLVYYLSECPNVTIMGMTGSACAAQSIGGCVYTSDCEFSLRYPMFATVDENNDVMVDTDAGRERTVPLDVEIPVTAEALDIIMNDPCRDYELEYAVDYLDKK